MSLKDFFVAGTFDDGDPVTGHYYEMASPDPARAQVWGYTDQLSYRPGDRLALHAMSSVPTARLTIARDGLVPEQLLDTEIAHLARSKARKFGGSGWLPCCACSCASRNPNTNASSSSRRAPRDR